MTISVVQLYNCADVTVILSEMDNYPTVGLESQACGTPVVSFNVGGAGETVKDGMGAVVPAFDFDQFSKMIYYWGKNKPNISDETYRTVCEIIDKQHMVDEYKKMYEEFLNGEDKTQS